MPRAPHKRSRAPIAAPAVSWQNVWWPFALIVVVGALVYANSLSGPFVLDDRIAILENTTLRQLSPISGALFAERESPLAGRPLVNLSFAANYALSGLNVQSYHAVNVAIHLACALLLFAIVRQTLNAIRFRPDRPWDREVMASVCAVLWMVHPLNTEAVNYITQRTELMMAFFYLLTLYGSLRAHATGERWGWQLAASVACGLGMACKESMVTAPVMVVLFDRAFLFDGFKNAVRTRWRLYLGLAASWVILALLIRSGPRMYSAGFSTGIRPWIYLLNQAQMIVQYLRLAVWPRALVFDYGYPRAIGLTDVLPQAIVVSLFVAATCAAWVFRPAAAFLGTWFFATLAPTSSIVPIATEVGADRRMYLPLMALVALLVMACVRAADTWQLARPGLRTSWVRRALVTLAVAAALALGLQTISRNRDYQSGLTLARSALERWPNSHARMLVGVELIDAGRQDEALAYLREAARDTARAHYPLGMELFRREQWDEARAELERFVQLEPALLEVVAARELIGLSFMRVGKPVEAEAQFRMMLMMRPGSVEARAELADALAAEQRYDEAVAGYRDYLARRPNDTRSMVSLGKVLATLGRRDEAIAAFRRAADLDPNDALAARNLAIEFFDADDFAGAATYASRAIALTPADAVSHNLLGIALAFQGHFDQALAELRRSIALDPANPDARDHLNRVLQMQAAAGRR